MADGVTMTYSSLETAARNVKDAEADLVQVISNLSSAVSALDGAWQGESYNAFVNAWNESKPTMQKLANAVGAFSPELTRAVSSQREAEAANASKMSSLAF